MQAVALALLHGVADERPRIDRERIAPRALHHLGYVSLGHIADAKIARAGMARLRWHSHRLVLKIKRRVRCLWRRREAHAAPHHRGPDDVPGPRPMRREPDGGPARAREARPETVEPHEEIIGEPAAD